MLIPQSNGQADAGWPKRSRSAPSARRRGRHSTAHRLRTRSSSATHAPARHVGRAAAPGVQMRSLRPVPRRDPSPYGRTRGRRLLHPAAYARGVLKSGERLPSSVVSFDYFSWVESLAVVGTPRCGPAGHGGHPVARHQGRSDHQTRAEQLGKRLCGVSGGTAGIGGRGGWRGGPVSEIAGDARTPPPQRGPGGFRLAHKPPQPDRSIALPTW